MKLDSMHITKMYSLNSKVPLFIIIILLQICGDGGGGVDGPSPPYTTLKRRS